MISATVFCVSMPRLTLSADNSDEVPSDSYICCQFAVTHSLRGKLRSPNFCQGLTTSIGHIKSIGGVGGIDDTQL